MYDLTRKFIILSCLLFTGFCFLKAGAGFFSQDNPASLPTAQAAFRAPISTNKRLITTPIQKLQPGMRVLGRNPDRFDTQPAIEPNPISWRLVLVRMEHKPGEYVLGKLLRPASWIRGNRAQAGAVISLEIPEMNVAGAAEVITIEACPPIKVGPGSVVTGTFEHVSDKVISVFVEGEEKPIGTTAKHPFWSKDRAAFVPAGELCIGEELKTALGTSTRVTSIEIRAGPETVYGLEVAGEHVYQIANAGLLVHNASGIPAGKIKIRSTDLSGGPHAPDTELNSIFSRAARSGDDQGQWLSKEAIHRAAARYDAKRGGVQVVKIDPGDGHVAFNSSPTKGKFLTEYPARPGAEIIMLSGGVETSRMKPFTLPTDRAIVIPKDDGLHLYPIYENHPDYDRLFFSN